MLLYELSFGQHEKSIARQSAQAREPLPERIANAPQLLEGLELYHDAFFDLDTTRSHIHGFTRISILDTKAYAEAWEFDEEQTAMLLYVVPRMDTELITYLKSKRVTTSANAEPSASSNAAPPKSRRR